MPAKSVGISSWRGLIGPKITTLLERLIWGRVDWFVVFRILGPIFVTWHWIGSAVLVVIIWFVCENWWSIIVKIEFFSRLFGRKSSSLLLLEGYSLQSTGAVCIVCSIKLRVTVCSVVVLGERNSVHLVGVIIYGRERLLIIVDIILTAKFLQPSFKNVANGVIRLLLLLSPCTSIFDSIYKIALVLLALCVVVCWSQRRCLRSFSICDSLDFFSVILVNFVCKTCHPLLRTFLFLWTSMNVKCAWGWMRTCRSLIVTCWWSLSTAIIVTVRSCLLFETASTLVNQIVFVTVVVSVVMVVVRMVRFLETKTASVLLFHWREGTVETMRRRLSLLRSFVTIWIRFRRRITWNVVVVVIGSCIFANWVEISLNLHQKLLLFANDHTHSTQTHPTDQTFSFEAILVHYVAPNEGSCASQACPTMNRNSLILADIAVCDSDKLADDVVVRARPVRELHLVNLNSLAFESRRIVKLVVQSDNTLHVHVKERVS